MDAAVCREGETLELFPEAVMRDAGWSGDTVVRQELRQLCRGAERSASRLGGRDGAGAWSYQALAGEKKKNPKLNSCGNYDGTFLRSQMSLVRGGGGGQRWRRGVSFRSCLYQRSVKYFKPSRRAESRGV